MLTYLYDSLHGFRKVFSRHRTWLIFVMIVLVLGLAHQLVNKKCI